MNAFDDFLGKEQVSFSEGWEVISREHFNQAEAVNMFSHNLGEDVLPGDLEPIFVKYGPGEWGDFETKDEQFQWWLRPTNCKGAKKVWAIDMSKLHTRIRSTTPLEAPESGEKK